MRTVKRLSPSINKAKKASLTKLVQAYAQEKQYWLNALRSWEYQSLLENPRKIRDALVKREYKSPFGLQARHWKLALQDAIETWDKYWQAIFVQVRLKISHHPMSEKERHYAYWLLASYQSFAHLMQGKEPFPLFEVEEKHKVASYVQRAITRIKSKPPCVKKARQVKFDADCYEVFTHRGVQYLKLMTLERTKRIVIPLLGHAKIQGNITVILKKDILAVHVSQKLKKTSKKQGIQDITVAVDFGYTEVMTDDQGIRYGKEFGEILTQGSNDLHEKMQKRHKLHSLKNSSKAANIRKYNLGRHKLSSNKRKLQASLEKEINTGINQLLKTKQPSILITENLRHPFSFHQPKSVNRKMSFWIKGKLQDRIAFKALAEGFRHEQVNPAYGSQTCPQCGFVDNKNRKGDKFKCLHCEHENMADRVAALNYARRFGDPEIGLYTPYRQVKTILQARFHRRLEGEQSSTVPGRTPETEKKVHPPLSTRQKSHPEERNLVNRSVTRRVKQNKHV